MSTLADEVFVDRVEEALYLAVVEAQNDPPAISDGVFILHEAAITGKSLSMKTDRLTIEEEEGVGDTDELE